MRKTVLLILAVAFSLSLSAQAVYVRDQKIVLEMVGQQTVLTPNEPDDSYFWVSLSPDKKRIAYFVAHKGAFVCDLKGKNVKSLGWLSSPTWMDNEMVAGMQEYYDARPDAYRTDYFCVSRDGKMRRDLTEHEIAWLNKTLLDRRHDAQLRSRARVAAKNAVMAAQTNTVGLEGIKIYLNPGHGGYDANDRSVWTINVPEEWTNPAGYWESKSNLVKGLFLRDMLEAAGATVYISRTTNNSGSRDIGYYNYRQGTPEYNAIMAGDDRDLREIAEEANANEVDHFLSIHSNAVNNRTNYLLMLYHGEDGAPTVAPSNQMAAMAGGVQIKNTLTVWNASSPYIRGDITFYGDSPTDPLAGLGVLRPLTVPGHLSEGSFHDYAPETHRLMNDDYCKLEALRMFQYFHKWFNRQLPQTACISGWVKSSNQTVDILEQPKFYYFPNTDDQWLPLNGATVILSDANGTPLDTVITDDWYNGIFAFYDLTPGTYIVTAEKGGYIAKNETITVAAEDIAQLKFRLAYTRVDLPDFEEPQQAASTLLLPDYTFVKDGSEKPLTESFKRILYREGKVYALREDGMLTIRDLDLNPLDTLPVMDGTPWADITFAADNFLLAGVAEQNSWKVYQYDPDFSSFSLMMERAVTGNVSGTLAASAPHWKATLWTTTATDLLSLNFDEDHPTAGEVTSTAAAGLNADTRVTLQTTGKVFVENNRMVPCFFRYAGKSLMAQPEVQNGKIGFRLWDMSGTSAQAISAFFPLSATADHAHAIAYADGYVMHITIVADGLGVQHFVSQIDEVANIFASELNFSDGKFTFRLNANALAATLKIEKEGNEVASTELGALPMGGHEIDNPFTTDDFDAYELTVSGKAISYPALISDDAALMCFATPVGVAVDRTPNSPYFGRIYVTDANGGAADGRTTTTGVYVLSSDLTDITAQGNTAYDGGVQWGEHNPGKSYQMALARPSVAPDGDVFVPSAAATSSGVYIMNAADPSAAFTTIFDGKRTKATGVIKKNGEVVTNPVMSCFITGYGKSEKLYTMDHNIASSQIITNINQYNIGEGLPWDKAPSAVIYDDNQNSGRMQNGSGQIYPDGRGGWWMSQYRYTSTVAVPSLIHVTNAKTDFNSGTSIGTSQNGGMAVSPDGNLIAIGRDLGTIAIYTVSYNAKNVPTLTEWCTIPYGENMETCITMGCEFDAAGNLYVVSHSNHRLMVFTMPKLENSFTTRREPIPADPIDAVQSVNNDTKKSRAHKRISRGQLLIDRDNDTFTAHGTRL